MGIQAATQSLDGTNCGPDTDERWEEWVSATSIRNFLLQDPLLDWFNRYGRQNGFFPDTELAGYEPRTDFTLFLFEKGRQFEVAVLAYLRTLFPVTVIAASSGESRTYEKVVATFAAMVQGHPLISQGVLWDAESRSYGTPDLLVRSDVLHQLFPESISEGDCRLRAPDLATVGGHYRVVEIKFTTLGLLAGGELDNSGSSPAYKGQLYLYNQALARLQGYQPPVSYLLGRGWEQTVKGQTRRSDRCFDRIAPVSQSYVARGGTSLASDVQAALQWVRRLRRNGEEWNVLPAPSVPELYPNMGNTSDGPWTRAKKRVAHEIEELTQLWYVGVDKRKAAHDLGIYRWRDPRCTAVSVGVTGTKTQPVLQAILDINHAGDGSPVRPARITAAEEAWRPIAQLEFFVDFETVSDLADDFRGIPQKGGQPLIFMIGCGHVEAGEWRFRCFITDELNAASEARIIESWLDHMNSLRQGLAPNLAQPWIFHWSHAETSNLRDAYNAAVRRHPERAAAWSEPRWFDFLKQVMKAEPVVTRGAMAFGLKAVAHALYEQGLISTQWESGPTDGLGAMVGGWRCAAEAAESNVPLHQIELMQQIRAYNEVDTKVMMELIGYFRQNH